MEKKIKVIRPLSELQNTKPKLRVCAYCRVSTEEENQNSSYETQKNYYEQYIKSNPEWEVVRIYADIGSGISTKKRNAFNEMLDDCEDNKIDLIICKSISRFARNTLDAIKIARKLRDDGIYIIFEKENINTEKTESELAFNLLASFTQMESESISKNIKQSMRNRFKNGEYSISLAPYGYTKIGKKELVINETEAEVVRMIFKMYIDGYSLKDITVFLREHKIGTNRKWYADVISSIIKNKIYIGTMVLQKHVSIECRRSVINTGYATTYELENEQPSIISKEDFKKANEILDVRRKYYFDKKIERSYSVLSGKIICDDCENALTKVTGNVEKYSCNNKGCNKNKITATFVKENFVAVRNNLVNDYEKLLIYVEVSNQTNDSEYNIEYKLKLNELTRQKEIIYRLKEDKIIDSAIFIEKNNKIDSDIANIEEKIHKLSFKNINEERKKLIKYLKNLSETKRIEETFQDNEFKNIIDKVYVKGSIVTYVIKGGISFEYKQEYEVFNHILYGYRNINGEHIVNVHEKDSINYIFDKFIIGKSVRQILEGLKERGFKTKRGNIIWDQAVIRGYLKNEAYIGNDKYPQIIEIEKFNKAQELIKEYKNRGKIKNG